MRINTVDTPIVTPPEVRPDVGGARAIAPVDPQTPGPAVPFRVPGTSGEEPQAPFVDRRRADRRGEDRRQRQVAVLIDTRVSQRRIDRRRTQDEPPPSIDTEA